MGKTTYELEARDLLFFRDARPMDVNKERTDVVFNVGHGANWPRPDHLFSAVIHELIRNPVAPEGAWYGKVPDLRVTGPFPLLGEKLYLPLPLDWDMKLVAFDAQVGVTDAPAPLSAGFADRVVEKKAYPKWITVSDYVRYLTGDVGKKKGPQEADVPDNADGKLFQREPRLGTTLDAATGASKRVAGRTESGQYAAEYLRLGKDVRMVCEIETERAAELEDRWLRFGGQGGLVRCARPTETLSERLSALPQETPTRFVRWTLLTPALFAKGWYPNWLEETEKGVRTGKVMLPMERVLRRPGESRAAYRARMKLECRPFETARLIAACIGKAVAFSGYDSQVREKPTELAVPAGSAYVFECETVEEAGKLVAALNLKPLSDLGEKGFGFGVCSYVAAPEKFTVESNG